MGVPSLTTNSPPSADMSIYPNPAYYESSVRFAITKPESIVFRVVTIDGREVHYHVGTYSMGEHTYVLRLPTGMYVVSIGHGNNWLNRRLVIVE